MKKLLDFGKMVRQVPHRNDFRLLQRLDVGIEQWIKEAEDYLMKKGSKPSTIEFFKILPLKLKLELKRSGFDEMCDYEDLKTRLIKVYNDQENNRYPKLSKFMNFAITPYTNIDVLADSIEASVNRIFNEKNTQKIIEKIAVDAYIYTSESELSAYLSKMNPKTMKKALKFTRIFKKRRKNDIIIEDIMQLAESVIAKCPLVEERFINRCLESEFNGKIFMTFFPCNFIFVK